MLFESTDVCLSAPRHGAPLISKEQASAKSRNTVDLPRSLGCERAPCLLKIRIDLLVVCLARGEEDMVRTLHSPYLGPNIPVKAGSACIASTVFLFTVMYHALEGCGVP